MEIIQKEFSRSKVYFELKEKYMMNRVRPFVAIGLVFWLAYMWQMLNAVTYFAGKTIITL